MGKQFDIAASTPPDLIKAAANGIDVVAVTGGVVESSNHMSMQFVVRKMLALILLKIYRVKLLPPQLLGLSCTLRRSLG
jgi:hypothetical protein